jgi:hypothetical protein
MTGAGIPTMTRLGSRMNLILSQNDRDELAQGDDLDTWSTMARKVNEGREEQRHSDHRLDSLLLVTILAFLGFAVYLIILMLT